MASMSGSSFRVPRLNLVGVLSSFGFLALLFGLALAAAAFFFGFSFFSARPRKEESFFLRDPNMIVAVWKCLYICGSCLATWRDF